MGWTLYEVNPSKIDKFSGNVDLTGGIAQETQRSLDPNIQNPYKFVYPAGRRWKIENICIPLDQRRYLKIFDQNSYPALSVLKRGRITGVTCGVANQIFFLFLLSFRFCVYVQPFGL